MTESEGFLQGTLVKLNRVSSDTGARSTPKITNVIAISPEINHQIHPLDVHLIGDDFYLIWDSEFNHSPSGYMVWYVRSIFC